MSDDHIEPKIINLGDLLRESDRQLEEARQTKADEKPWRKWPSTFNEGTCEENDAFAALGEAIDMLDTMLPGDAVIPPNFGRNGTWRYGPDSSYEFKVEAFNTNGWLILRAYPGEHRCERIEVRRG